MQSTKSRTRARHSLFREASDSSCHERVEPAFAGKPVLDAQRVEDVAAFLLTPK
jgi:hypothetical protein